MYELSGGQRKPAVTLAEARVMSKRYAHKTKAYFEWPIPLLDLYI